MVFHPIAGSSKDHLKGKVLIIPSVSLANLPQLTVDLLIPTLSLSLSGYIGSGDTVAPLFGITSDGPITGGLEVSMLNKVYTRDDLGVMVIQQRSPVLKNKKDEHVELIRRFVEEVQPSFTLLLTSLDAANQDDQTSLTPHVSILPPSSSSTSTKIAETLSDLLPPYTLSPLTDPSSSTSSNLSPPPPSTPPYPPFIPGGGLSRRLLTAFSSGTAQQPIPHGSIAAWCVEGDNRGDAHHLAQLILRLLQTAEIPRLFEGSAVGVTGEIKEPKEWEGLFGVSQGWSGGMGVDAELYG